MNINDKWHGRSIGEIKEGAKQWWISYLIGDDGRVYSDRCQRLLRHNNNNGYMQVYLTHPDTHAKRWFYVHRLVAELFIPNHLGLKDVNHKDGDKSNNNHTNLEWVSHSDNIKHRYSVLGQKAKSGADHFLFGGHHKESTKKLMSEAKMGENHPKFKGWYIIPDGQRFASPGQANREIGIPEHEIRRKCLSDKYPEWKFESKSEK